MQIWHSNSLSDTTRIGEQIYPQLGWPACVWMRGELGAGKTSLCQAIIHAAGYQQAVTSPTYNLIQEYPVADGVIYHMDLYRLQDAEELEYLGLGDLWGGRSLFLVEWPERGAGRLPAATHSILLQHAGDQAQRRIEFVQET